MSDLSLQSAPNRTLIRFAISRRALVRRVLDACDHLNSATSSHRPATIIVISTKKMMIFQTITPT